MNYTIEDGRSRAFQWDKDVVILLPDIADGTELHFGVSAFNSIRRIVAEGKVTIPNVLLQKNRDIPMFVYIDDITTDSALIPVVGRPKPPDYIYTETEVLVWESVTKRMDDIENAWNGGVYYEVEATQPDDYTMRMTYIPTHEGMKEIPPQDITLPKGGPRGDPGKSAYEYAQGGGYTGTEAEFMAKLALEIDSTPTPGSKNLVSSSGVYTALGKKLNAAGVTTNSFLVGAGTSVMEEKSPAEVLALIGAAPAGLVYEYRSCADDAAVDAFIMEQINDSTFANRTKRNIVVYPTASGTTLTYGQMWFLELWKSSASYGAITAKTYANSGVSVWRRQWNTNKLIAWEQENPALAVGKEYRTTEKMSGHPVYCQRLGVTLDAWDGTAAPVTITIPHGIADFDTIVRISGRNGNTALLPYFGSSGSLTVLTGCGAENITLRSTAKWSSSYWTFDIYYTKTS